MSTFKAKGLSFRIAIGYESRLSVFSNSRESFVLLCVSRVFLILYTYFCKDYDIKSMKELNERWKVRKYRTVILISNCYFNIELLFYIVFILVIVVFVLYRNNSTSYSTLRESLETSLSLLSILRHQGN